MGAQIAAVFNLDNILIFALALCDQVVQRVLHPQNAQIVRHLIPMQVRIGLFAAFRLKLRAHIQLAQFVIRLVLRAHILLAKHLLAVRGAVHRVVMKQHQHIVLGDMQVKLKHINGEVRVLGAILKGTQSLVRFDPAAAAVAGNVCLFQNIWVLGVVRLNLTRVRPMVAHHHIRNHNGQDQYPQYRQHNAPGTVFFPPGFLLGFLQRLPLLQGSISEFCIFRYYLLIVSVLNSL